jgi:putative flippase GtrA
MSVAIREIVGTRVFRFVVVGVGAAGLLFVLSFLLVSAGLPPFTGSVIAYAAAFAVAYTAQRSWTFGGRHDHGRALPRYFILQLCCAAFSGTISHIAVNRLSMSPLAMSALTTIAASAVSYVFSSKWVFQGKHPAGSQECLAEGCVIPGDHE